MADLSTLSRLYTELCRLWRVKHTPEEYKRAEGLFLAHARHLQLTLCAAGRRELEGLILRWEQTAPRLSSERSCGKIVYLSRAKALQRAKGIPASSVKQKPYSCPKCGSWQLTSTTRREYKQHVADGKSERLRKTS